MLFYLSSQLELDVLEVIALVLEEVVVLSHVLAWPISPLDIPNEEEYRKLVLSMGVAYVGTGIFGGRVGKGASNFKAFIACLIEGRKL